MNKTRAGRFFPAAHQEQSMNRTTIHCSIRNVLLACLLASPLLTSAAAPGTATIDGKTYTGTIVKQGEVQGDPDDFVFKDGTFISTACAGFGFKPGAYTVKHDGKRLQFSAENKTDAGVRMIWRGMISGDHLEATSRWIRPNQPVVEFHADASLKH